MTSFPDPQFEAEGNSTGCPIALKVKVGPPGGYVKGILVRSERPFRIPSGYQIVYPPSMVIVVPVI